MAAARSLRCSWAAAGKSRRIARLCVLAYKSSPETMPLGCDFMVGVRRFELLTSSVSGKRSPPELNARISAAGVAARNILRENALEAQPSIASFSRITNTAQREEQRGLAYGWASGPSRPTSAVTGKRHSFRRIAPFFLNTAERQLGKCGDRLSKGAILCERGQRAGPRGGKRGSDGDGKRPGGDKQGPPSAPPNQTCGLIAVRREGPAHLPAVLLGNVIARVLLTRRFPGGELAARPAQDESLPRASKRRRRGHFARNPC